ncbi:ArsR/SmtB family transcription factor [Kitasatospora sp. NPDC059648]|uniref:ArsR/SmtB family transcription factor n=1 Tax=Kitasatospora sp. NPDC059648 TaxID=3346894 RepID=UPI0036858EC1
MSRTGTAPTGACSPTSPPAAPSTAPPTAPAWATTRRSAPARGCASRTRPARAASSHSGQGGPSGPHTTGELARAWDLTPPGVSRHLALLRCTGLLTTRRHGRYVSYTLDPASLTMLGSDVLAAVLC